MISLVRAPNPGPFTLDGTNSWVIGGECVIDPGPAIEEHVDALQAAAPRLSSILITHRHGDHAPAALGLKQRTGAAIHAPEGVLPAGPVDARLRDGDVVTAAGLRIQAIATPGHTGEHVCFLTAEGDLFTGDMVLGAGTTAIFPPDGHMGRYLESLAKLRERAPRRIFPGHGPVREDADALLADYIAHRLDRERQIVHALRRGPATISSLRSLIYPDIPAALHPAAEAQLLAHLIHLEEQELVAVEGDTFRLRR